MTGFCRHCGGGIPPRDGEGQCDQCSIALRARNLLAAVGFLGYVFIVGKDQNREYLQAKYMDADSYTKRQEWQYTRKWLLSPTMTDSEIIQTAFKLCMTSFEHRCREGFLYQGARIFGPHFDVNDLVNLCEDRENAGGRSGTSEVHPA